MNLSIHISETIEDISQKFTIKVRVLLRPRLDAGVLSAERGLTTEWERGDHLAISAGSHSPLRTKTFSFLAFTRLFFFLKFFLYTIQFIRHFVNKMLHLWGFSKNNEIFIHPFTWFQWHPLVDIRFLKRTLNSTFSEDSLFFVLKLHPQIRMKSVQSPYNINVQMLVNKMSIQKIILMKYIQLPHTISDELQSDVIDGQAEWPISAHQWSSKH